MQAPSTTPPAAFVLALGLCGVGLSAPAHACDLSEPPTGPQCPVPPPLDVGEVPEPVQHSSVLGTQLILESIDARRSRYSGPGNGDCGELGSTRLQLRLPGFEAWPEDIAVRVQVASGSYFGDVARGDTEWVWPTAEGTAGLIASDDPRVPMDATLILTAVDCAGDETVPIEARLVHPGYPNGPDAGAVSPNAEESTEQRASEPSVHSEDPLAARESRSLGCSLPTAPSRPAFALALVSLLALALVRRSAPTCRSGS